MNLLTKTVISTATILTLISINGCSSMRNMIIEDSIQNIDGSQDSKKVTQFEKRFNQVLDNVDKKDDYKKLPLNTSDTKWLVQQSFKLWNKQISKTEYIKTGENKFPGYTKTFSYLADEFKK